MSSGSLSNRDDRDLFKLEDLPATSNSARDGQANKWSRKRYRVQAWFGDHAPGAEQGGEIFIMEAPSGSGSLYSAVSDTNEDGLSFFEFEAFPNIDYYVMVVPTAAVQVKSGSGYGLDNRTYTGAYKLQIDDVSHIEEMADTLHETGPSGPTRVRVTTWHDGLDDRRGELGSLGLDRTVAFYTGSNSGGYVLNRIEAAVSEPRCRRSRPTRRYRYIPTAPAATRHRAVHPQNPRRRLGARNQLRRLRGVVLGAVGHHRQPHRQTPGTGWCSP